MRLRQSLPVNALFHDLKLIDPMSTHSYASMTTRPEPSVSSD